MHLDDIDRVLQRRPFRPFRVILSTREVFDVLHPEMMMIGERFVAIGRRDDPLTDELRMHWIDSNHVVEMHRLETPT